MSEKTAGGRADNSPNELEQSRVLDGAAAGMAAVVVMTVAHALSPMFGLEPWMILAAILLPALAGFVVDIGRLQ